MNTPSSRYVAIALVCLAIALVVTTVNDRWPRYRDFCANPEALVAEDLFMADGAVTTVTDRLSDRVPMWLEGELRLRGRRGPVFQTLVTRSFDPISMYLQPDHLKPMPSESDKGDFERVVIDGVELPIRFLYVRTSSRASWGTHFTAFAFIYDGRPVASPFFAQIASGPSDLIYGKQPLTMLLVKGAVSNLYLEEAKELAKSWIGDAWSKYEATCSG